MSSAGRYPSLQLSHCLPSTLTTGRQPEECSDFDWKYRAVAFMAFYGSRWPSLFDGAVIKLVNEPTVWWLLIDSTRLCHG